MASTEYVFGLFEGGGAKGVAYAGVVEACAGNGIRFEGACGVSAGAIAAALVSAGILPAGVVELLRTPMNEILKWRRPSASRRIRSCVSRWSSLSGWGTSEGIERWLEEVLQERLGIRRTVLFEDLPRPLAVFAYDLQNKRAFVWSTQRTPYRSVAFAVRASCTLPVLFAPAQDDHSKFWDGGIIENAPAFLIEEISHLTNLPTFAFRLVPSTKQIVVPRIFDPARFIFGKLGEIIDARSAVSRPQGLELIDVPVDCGNVNTTRFNLLGVEQEMLVQAGRAAVREHLNRRVRLPSFKVDEVTSDEASRVKHATLIHTAELIGSAARSVDFFSGDASWLAGLAAHIVRAHGRGVRLRLLTHKAPAESVENAKKLGVSVGYMRTAQPLRGTLVDSGGMHAKILLVERRDQHPTRFSAQASPRTLAHLVNTFEDEWIDAQVAKESRPVIKALSFDLLSEGLSRVGQYAGLEFSLEYLAPHQVRPSSNYVETFKLTRLEHVEWLYALSSARYGYHIVGTPWFSMLPIVERREDEGDVVIDGTHRFYDAYVRGRKVWAIVVQNCISPLPSQPVRDWDHVRISTAKLPREERFTNYAAENFRPLKATLSTFLVARHLEARPQQ